MPGTLWGGGGEEKEKLRIQHNKKCMKKNMKITWNPTSQKCPLLRLSPKSQVFFLGERDELGGAFYI